MRANAARQRGVALITALLIVALAAMLASSLVASQNLSLHRSGNLLALEQAGWYAQGAEAWAGSILKRDRQDNGYDHPGEPWAKALNYLPVDGGALSGVLVDAQAQFNLNNLIGSKAEASQKVLERLLQNLSAVDSFSAPALVQSIRDWMDADTEPGFPDGAEDDYYQSQRDLAYRAANRPFTSLSELRLVRGMTPKLFRALSPYLTVLPVETPINVNAAPAALLAALAPDVKPESLIQLTKARELKPYESTSEFIADPAFAGRSIDPALVSVDTRFFTLHVKAEVGSTHMNLYSLLFRGDNGQVQVYRHSRDTL